jgi:hypothetical protein
MLLPFLAPEVATFEPVGPGPAETDEALSEVAGLWLPAATSCHSTIAVGGVVAVLPLEPNSPRTILPGPETMIESAAIEREFFEIRPECASTGRVWSIPRNTSRAPAAPTWEEKRHVKDAPESSKVATL